MADSTDTSAARAEPVAQAPPPPRREVASDDAAILALVERGAEREALIELMRRHGDPLYAFCLRLRRDPDRAADVQQQVFLEAYRDLRTFGGKSALRTWLFSIARHRGLDAIKSHAVHAGPRHRPESELEVVAGGGPAIDE